METEPKRMCINCSNSSVTGHGLFCRLESPPVKIEEIRTHCCGKHRFFREK